MRRMNYQEKYQDDAKTPGCECTHPAEINEVRSMKIVQRVLLGMLAAILVLNGITFRAVLGYSAEVQELSREQAALSESMTWAKSALKRIETEVSKQ